jgi:DNA N-6-adenine-methyltransferase (Dam)
MEGGMTGGAGFCHEHGQGANVTWLTPPQIIAALGPFDLDPCAAVGQPWATARVHYTVVEDGLVQPWFGFVWCNAPFGPGLRHWLARMADHGNGIALVPARTETHWFVEHVWQRADGLLFLHGRLRFHAIDGQPAKSTIGTPICLVAYGLEAVRRLCRATLAGTFATWRAA